mgnify:CR=1 FL=1
MFKLANLTKTLVLAGLALGLTAESIAQSKYSGIGRPATKAEVIAWDLSLIHI